MPYPAVELLCCGLFRLGDQLVEAGFGDEGGLSHAPAVPLNEIWGNAAPLISVQLTEVHGGAAFKTKPEGAACVRSNEPWLAHLHDDAKLKAAEVEGVEVVGFGQGATLMNAYGPS